MKLFRPSLALGLLIQASVWAQGASSIRGIVTDPRKGGSADPTWTNGGNANYHAMILTIRKALSSGFGFDLNYTWSHSIDNGSGVASGSGQFGGILQNAFVPSANRGPSSFDLRHQINANFVYELPFGEGKMLFSKAPKWVTGILGGWQASGLVRVVSGAPLTIGGSGVFPTNYGQGSVAIPNGTSSGYGSFIDTNGNPSIFKATSVISAYQDSFPGDVGYRGIVRGPWQRATDVSLNKTFRLPWEHHLVSLRADAFNVLNFVNWDVSSLSASLSSPSTFGEFSRAGDARVLQLALRYSF